MAQSSSPNPKTCGVRREETATPPGKRNGSPAAATPPAPEHRDETPVFLRDAICRLRLRRQPRVPSPPRRDVSRRRRRRADGGGRRRRMTRRDDGAGGGGGEGGVACGDIREHARAPPSPEETGAGASNEATRLCRAARSCKGDALSRALLPRFLCRGEDDDDTPPRDGAGGAASAIVIRAALSFTLVAYLFLLFRLLGGVADGYFSPALELFSLELGLPPRFAGATLLALANGSPDLFSTANSILHWSKEGAEDEQQEWLLSLGSLTGGGLFVGTVVLGLVIR